MMGLFGFKKKTNTTASCRCKNSCPTAQEAQEARFIVLGTCCQKSADSFANVQRAVAELGFSDEVINIGDDVQIAQYGVLQTPALVVGQKVLCSGRLIRVEEAKALIDACLLVRN